MPPRRTTPKGYENARKLRKEPTPAEGKLWAYLRGNKLNGINFRRQHAIGNYVPDFCSPKAKLIIDVTQQEPVAQYICHGCAAETGKLKF